jgi:D-glycero-D-manno-heptose 1,7-bisphosphate phosphatase
MRTSFSYSGWTSPDPYADLSPNEVVFQKIGLHQPTNKIVNVIFASPNASETMSTVIIAAMHPAIFLDRDGVIIENRPSYVRSWADVVIFPQALEALARIHSSPYKIVIVTNQSAIGRGILPLGVARDINRRLIKTVQEAGGRVDGIFMCPHAPGDQCDCRKPKPGLLWMAAQALSLNLSQSIMIGDAITDLLAGQAAGIPYSILVRTGRGASQALLPLPADLKPFQIYDSLASAFADLVKT